MANLLSNPSYKANIGYNGFDMSQLLKFSSSVGELLPVYYDFLLPGDKVSFSSEIKTRTMSLEAAAMCSITEHIDWFFVPLEQIYSVFGSWFYGINDIKSSLVDPDAVDDTFPFVSGSTLLTGLRTILAYNGHTSTVLDDFGRNNTCLRLIEMLGIDTDALWTAVNDDAIESLPLSLNPMYFCAYQKIYADCYMLKDRERCDPKSWSLDAYYSIGSAISIPSENLPKFFRLHYRPWERDFFTNLYVSPIFGSGDLSSLVQRDEWRVLETGFSQWLVNGLEYEGRDSSWDHQTQDPELNTHVEQNYTGSNVTALRNQVGAFTSPTAIRTAFAVQKLLEVTRRAGKHVDKQQLAHFGVSMPTGVSGEVISLGGSSSSLNIGDVIATSTTEDSVLGQVGGKGYGYGKSGKRSFTASSHGILMAIYSAVPKSDYKQGFDRLHTYVDSASFPRPEFDNLGMQPLFSYQGAYVVDDPTANYDVDGWQYRWSEIKSKANRVTGALSRSLSYWSPQRKFAGNILRSFLIDPKYLDDIMLVNYNPSYSSSWSLQQAGCFATDPLIHEIYFDVKKASKMSTYGLEQL